MKKNVTIDEIAAMTNRGFHDLEGRLTNRMEKGFTELAAAITELTKGMDGLTRGLDELTKGVDQNFRQMHSRLDLIRGDVVDLPNMREELVTLRQRVDRLEKKAGSVK